MDTVEPLQFLLHLQGIAVWAGPKEQCLFTEAMWTQDRQRLHSREWQVPVDCSLGAAEAPAEVAAGRLFKLKRQTKKVCQGSLLLL